MISCCLSLLFLCFSWLNKNIVGTSSTVRIIFNGKPNHSHKKQKDSLEGSLDKYYLWMNLSCQIVPRLSQHTLKLVSTIFYQIIIFFSK